ncbi:MAG: DUF4249 domain-containing protein [Aureispira sp.]|nr:DUF4249 domain-containing protein [Aureispira sp.]
MSRVTSILIFIAAYFSIISCEEEYIPESVFDEPEIVVEGYLESGPNALPPYILLTKSFPYTESFGPDKIAELFVHDAEVTISDGANTSTLTEFCLADLDNIFPGLKAAALQAIGFGNINGIENIDLCIYVDLPAIIGLSSLDLKEGGSYNLTIQADGKTITSKTTIPYHVPLDTLYYANHQNYPENDSLVEFRGRFQDPLNEANYYRIFTQRNRETMYAGGTRGNSGSVSDDKIFNGQAFEFVIQRGQSFTSGDFDIDTYGYFSRGDTVTIRAASLDYEHFRFWQTLEYNDGSQGPFGSYTRIESNIEGGLGIWGGLSYDDYTLIVPK